MDKKELFDMVDEFERRLKKKIDSGINIQMTENEEIIISSLPNTIIHSHAAKVGVPIWKIERTVQNGNPRKKVYIDNGNRKFERRISDSSSSLSH